MGYVFDTFVLGIYVEICVWTVTCDKFEILWGEGIGVFSGEVGAAVV